jgi:zinc transport system ATP-binding protein
MNLITVENLSVSYGSNTVLRGIDFKIELGEIVTIVGPNGSGKTSLLKAIIGAIQPCKGLIKLKPGLKIGYVPQRLNFESTLPITVERFVCLTGKVGKKSCLSALEIAGVPELLQHQMSELSGGQFQRVLLAQSLLGNPELLILDEATQGLDQPGSAAFYRQIEDVRRNSGCAVLMISHDLHVVMSASDRVICLNGHVCCAGTPALVASMPEYKALFGAGTDGALALYRHEHDHNHDHKNNTQTASK